MLFQLSFFLLYRFHGNIHYLRKHIQLNIQSFFQKTGGNFNIDQIKGMLVKRQLKMLGMVQKKLHRATLLDRFCSRGWYV